MPTGVHLGRWKVLSATLLSVQLMGGLSASASLIGWWGFNDVGASAGGVIGQTLNQAANQDLTGTGVNNALYSSDVPGPFIYDPVANTYRANTFSMNSTANNAGVTIPGNTAGEPLDTASFTVEFFLKLDISDLPSSFVSMIRRRSGSGSSLEGWQIDYNSATFSTGGANPNSGRIRSRFDTLTQQNQSFQGALVNDGVWHHVALTYNAATNQARIFTDYVAGATLTPNGTMTNFVDIFIAQSGASFTLIDEVRYHGAVLTPDQFMQVSAIPEPSTLALLLPAIAWFFRRRLG